MRSLIPIVLALACPIGMCLVPMMLMRRRGDTDSHGAATTEASEVEQLRAEVARLRAGVSETEDAAK